MLKPKYVHGLNAEEAPKSLLNRLQNDGLKVWPLDDIPTDDPSDDSTGDVGGMPAWTWHLG